MSDKEQRARLAAQRAEEKDPATREAYALAARAGFDWYDTESNARRAFKHAAEEIVDLRAKCIRFHEALMRLACWDDEAANARLKATGSYGLFDEPGSVFIARNALDITKIGAPR